MQVGILATSGGPHSAAAWAAATAGQIIQIGENASGVAAAEARRLELAILDILEDAHGAVQDVERERLEAFGPERLLRPMNVLKKLEEPFQAILKAAQASVYAEHFAQEEVQQHLRSVLGSHFATSMQVERLWHADANPDSAEAKAVQAGAVAPAVQPETGA